MKTRHITNLSASVHQRLLNLAQQTNRPFNELLQYYTMERFLFRLSHSHYGDRFILKGALMLRAWSIPMARPTKDIDFLARMPNNIEGVVASIKECLGTEVPDDGVRFDSESIRGEKISLDAAYQGVRVHVRGLLGNARLTLQLDFGFGDVIVPGPVWIDYPELLDFGPPHLLGYPVESAIAEKFQALVELELANTRLKDFYDLWKLSRSLNFDGAILSRAIAETFRQRGTPLPTSPPLALTNEFTSDATKEAQWRAFLRKGRLETGEVSKLSIVISKIAEFLLPISYALAEGNAFDMQWIASKSWLKQK